jgi:hypothetical protein|tara:strand:+ start:59 stop:175 length:117 start_codon:yes stop_codon:yes gene_type:complete
VEVEELVLMDLMKLVDQAVEQVDILLEQKQQEQEIHLP